ncbi:MAG: GNAT family N-acetyltransferase [Sulfitobacter sp.]
MSVKVVQTHDIDACLALRRIVFIDEQNVPEADELDGLDGRCLHLMATDDATPVGTARIYIQNSVAKIGRVCVLKSHRGTGLGAALINAALDLARSQDGVRTAKLGAQVHATAFYQALGFAETGPIYKDAGIDHQDMVRAL